MRRIKIKINAWAQSETLKPLPKESQIDSENGPLRAHRLHPAALTRFQLHSRQYYQNNLENRYSDYY